MDGHVLSGGEGRGRTSNGIRHVFPVCLSHPGRAIRELVVALQRSSFCSGGGSWIQWRTAVAQVRQQRLRPDWADHADRTDGQERHPNR